MSNRGASYVERDRCPVYTAIRVIEGRWKPMICRRLGESPHGFGELRRAMPGVTIKVLRQHLRQLEMDGVVARSVRQKPTLRVRYRLTPHGRTLGPVFETLWTWGTRHLARPVAKGDVPERVTIDSADAYKDARHVSSAASSRHARFGDAPPGKG